MSNKLAKHQKQKERLTGKQKKVLFWSCFAALSIAFVMVWLNVFLTSNALDRQMEEMVLGEDYDREDVVITDKRSEDASADNAISQNYFFYYHGGKTNEYNKRMQVPESVYTEYEVGDTITAYTTDHIKYSYNKAGILPDKKYRNNELESSRSVAGSCNRFPEFVGLIKQKDKLKTIISGEIQDVVYYAAWKNGMT